MKSFGDWKIVTTRSRKKLMKNHIVRKALVEGGIAKKCGCSTPYLKYVKEVLRKHVRFCGKDDITFLPEQGHALQIAVSPTKKYIRAYYINAEKYAETLYQRKYVN